MVTFQSIPTTNTRLFYIRLALNGNILETIDPGEAKIVTGQFDQIIVYNPFDQTVFNQITPGNFVAQVGNVAFIEDGIGPTANLEFSTPNSPSTVVQFA